MGKRIAVIAALAAAGSAHAIASAPKAAADETAQAKAWAEFATPNENHRRLGAFVGSWKIHVTFWPRPDAPPQTSDGTAEIRWVLGGRYLEQRQDCPLMGQPMSGIGYTGFDNIKRRYVTTWMDNLGTSILQTSGTYDPAKKAITTRGTIDDVLTRKPLRYEDALTFPGPDAFTYEAWTSSPGGSEMNRVMEIAYTRRSFPL